jgi:hypothetical protein
VLTRIQVVWFLEVEPDGGGDGLGAARHADAQLHDSLQQLGDAWHKDV